jgi:hypothetical protein
MKTPIFTLLALAALPALAQDAKPAAAAEPKVQRIVVQDDQVRIEEERVRGVTRKVTVKPKDAAAYEVLPTSAARDPSQAHRGSEGAAGKRVWNVLNF